MTRFPALAWWVSRPPRARLGAFAGLTMAVNWTHTHSSRSVRSFGLTGSTWSIETYGRSGRKVRAAVLYLESSSALAFTAQILIGYRM